MYTCTWNSKMQNCFNYRTNEFLIRRITSETALLSSIIGLSLFLILFLSILVSRARSCTCKLSLFLLLSRAHTCALPFSFSWAAWFFLWKETMYTVKRDVFICQKKELYIQPPWDTYMHMYMYPYMYIDVYIRIYICVFVCMCVWLCVSAADLRHGTCYSYRKYQTWPIYTVKRDLFISKMMLKCH